MKKSDLLLLASHDVQVFGDLAFRGDCPSETAEAMAFFSALRLQFPDLFEIAFHVRNEGKKSKLAGYQQKQEGLLAGAPDVIIMTMPPIAIELKRRDHTKSAISPGQIKRLALSRREGWLSCVALGSCAALEVVKNARKS